MFTSNRGVSRVYQIKTENISFLQRGAFADSIFTQSLMYNLIQVWYTCKACF